MELIGELLSKDSLIKQTKDEFNELMKKKVNLKALKYLKYLQWGHSKTKDINYEKLYIQPYI